MPRGSCRYQAGNAKIKPRSLVEETEAHVFVRGLLLRFLLLGLSGRGASITARGSSSRGSRGVGIRVGNAVLELLDLIPLVFGLDSNSKNLLVRVDDGVHDGWQGGVADGQGDAGNSGD